MRCFFVYFIFLLELLNSCTEKRTEQTIEKKEQVANSKETKIDFLNDCEDFSLSRGKIQGLFETVSQDSLTSVILGECLDSSNTYDVIFSPKMELSKWKDLIVEDAVMAFFKKDRKNGFPNFDCYVFVIPKIKPELLKDEHDSNIKFPVNVKIFVKSYNEDWKQVSVKSFKTFESYSLAKFRAFYRQI